MFATVGPDSLVRFRYGRCTCSEPPVARQPGQKQRDTEDRHDNGNPHRPHDPCGTDGSDQKEHLDHDPDRTGVGGG